LHRSTAAPGIIASKSPEIIPANLDRRHPDAIPHHRRYINDCVLIKCNQIHRKTLVGTAFILRIFYKEPAVREKTEICLIRHGETAWNAELRIQGHCDLPLNETGLLQAEALARRLAERHFDAIYSSDLARARQTAEPLARAHRLSVRIDAALRERNFGCWEGKTREEMLAADAAMAEALAARRPDDVPPGGESLRQHLARILSCLSRLASLHAGQTLAVVTHGGTLDLAYRHAQGIPIERPRDFPLSNASINWLEICGDGWRFASWGDAAHLDGIAQAPFVTRI
jgi:probable phosphoglycerate mutase